MLRRGATSDGVNVTSFPLSLGFVERISHSGKGSNSEVHRGDVRSPYRTRNASASGDVEKSTHPLYAARNGARPGDRSLKS